MAVQTKHPTQLWSWERLRGLVDPTILAAPQVSWDQVEYRNLRYLLRTVAGSPWLEHLVLLTGVLTSYAQLDAASIRQYLLAIHSRWKTLFPAYDLNAMDQWDAIEHLSRYMSDTLLADSLSIRQTFLRNYAAAAAYSQGYLRSLSLQEQATYQKWALPAVPSEVMRQLSRNSELIEVQHQQRKQETDILAPHFATLRTEAHWRWNELHRLRHQFHEVIHRVEAGQATIPLAFSYEEPRRHQRLHFLLWDAPSFMQARADQEQAKQTKVDRFKHSSFFLEWVRTEPLDTWTQQEGEQDLLWFGDLLRYQLLSHRQILTDSEEGQQQWNYLRSWGYGVEGEEEGVSPFATSISGLLV